MDNAQIYAIERPHPDLLKIYLIRTLISGPFSPMVLPLLFFKYKTMRYKIDDEGISMSWGLLFRQEINLTYARIQDIHLSSGIFQRWLGLADLQIQTASGKATAEMTIEGVKEFEALRDFLYTRMRGNREAAGKGQAKAQAALANAEAVELLREIHADMKAVRQHLEAGKEG